MGARHRVTGAAVIAALSIVEDLLTEEERRPQPPRVSGWRDFLRQAAQAGARLLEAQPTWCAGLGFDGRALSEGQRRLSELEEAREALAARLQQLDGAIVLHKRQLTQRTRRLHAAVTHRLADPSLAPAPRLQLLGESAALRRAFAQHAERQERRRQRSLAEGRALGEARASWLDAHAAPVDRPRRHPAIDAAAVVPDLELAAADGADEVQVLGAAHRAQHDVAHLEQRRIDRLHGDELARLDAAPHALSAGAELDGLPALQSIDVSGGPSHAR